MISPCDRCNGTGYFEHTESGISMGFKWSATSRQRCSCQQERVTLNDARSIGEGARLKTAQAKKLTALQLLLLRFKARWQLRGRIGVDVNGNVWRGLRLFYHPPNEERRALREALELIED